MTPETTSGTSATPWTSRMAATLDRVAHDIFDLVRWVCTLGIVRYL